MTRVYGRIKSRILLAEDDQVIRPLVGVMLRRAGYEVDFADDGLAAVEMWEGGKYDLVLMDLQMPRLDGIEASRAIREKERTAGGRTSIVALTAHSDPTDVERCLAAGMDTCIHKPIDFRVALKEVEEVLQ